MSDLLTFFTYLYHAIRMRLFLWLACAFVAALLEGLGVALFLPIIGGVDQGNPVMRLVTQTLESVGLEYSLSVALLFIVIFFVFRSGFLVIQEMYAQRIVTRLLINLKRGLIDKLFEADYQYFLSKEIGYYTNALTIEYNRVAFAFETCMRIVITVGFALVYLALPLAVNPEVAGAVLVLGIPGYFALRRVNQLTRRYSLIVTEANSRLNSYILQAFYNFKYLKATDSGAGIQGKAHEATEEQGALRYKQSVLDVLTRQSTEFFLVALIVALLFYNVVIRGLELVAILFLMFLLRRAITFVMEAQTAYRKFLSASGSIRVFQQLERELDENREDVRVNGPAPDFKQPIVLKGVGFSYVGGERVLKNVSVKIPPNKIVGIVGESGSGKSTLTTLLTGILTPTEGAIYLGDVNYQDLDQASLRRGIGYVTQETVIFNETIRNNITLWRDDTQEEKVRAAASKAHLAEFIANLPRGYDTVMGDAGINASGGERQRISIAREMFKNAEFLIFDEATSSLDSKTEREIQERIEELRGEKTVVIIAHRLSTVRNSDLIVVLKEGEIVEQGEYEMLYARGGEFTAMVDRQALTME